MIAPASLPTCEQRFEKKTALVRGKKVHYAEANPKGQKTVLVIHGLTGTHYSMLAFSVVCAERGDHVIVMDIPGHGKSEKIPVTSMKDLGNWVQDVIEALRLAGDLTVVGYSFGANIVLAYAQENEVAASTKLILAAPIPTIRPVLHRLDRMGAAAPDKFARRVYYNNALLEAFRTSYLLTDHKNKQFRQCVAEGIRVEGPLVNHRYASQELMGANLRHNPFRDALPESLRERTTVIYGLHDTVAGKAAMRYMRDWSKGLRVIETNCGHLLHIEAIEDLKRAIYGA